MTYERFVIRSLLYHQERSFAYALAPNTTAAAMPSVFAASAGAACVTNGVDVQGAAQPSAGVVGAVFWPGASQAAFYSCNDPALSGGTLTLSVNMPAMVVVRVNATAVSVSVSQPLALGSTVVVTVSRTATGQGCTPGAGGQGTDFALETSNDPNYIGAPVTVACELAA